MTYEVFGFGSFRMWTGEDATPVPRSPGGKLKPTVDDSAMEVVYTVAKLKPGMARA